MPAPGIGANTNPLRRIGTPSSIFRDVLVHDVVDDLAVGRRPLPQNNRTTVVVIGDCIIGDKKVVRAAIAGICEYFIILVTTALRAMYVTSHLNAEGAAIVNQIVRDDIISSRQIHAVGLIADGGSNFGQSPRCATFKISVVIDDIAVKEHPFAVAEYPLADRMMDPVAAEDHIMGVVEFQAVPRMAYFKPFNRDPADGYLLPGVQLHSTHRLVGRPANQTKLDLRPFTRRVKKPDRRTGRS